MEWCGEVGCGENSCVCGVKERGGEASLPTQVGSVVDVAEGGVMVRGKHPCHGNLSLWFLWG